MKSGSIELRWAYVAFGLLAGIDVLAGIRILRRMVWHLEPPAPDAPLFVLLFLLLHVVLLWLFHRLRNLLRYDQRLRAMYEQELGFAQQLLDASTEGLVMFSTEGRITYVNRRAAGSGRTAVSVDPTSGAVLVAFDDGTVLSTLVNPERDLADARARYDISADAEAGSSTPRDIVIDRIA